MRKVRKEEGEDKMKEKINKRKEIVKCLKPNKRNNTDSIGSNNSSVNYPGNSKRKPCNK